MSAAGVWLRTQVLARLQADASVKAVLGDPARVFDAGHVGAAYPNLGIARHEIRAAEAADAAADEHRIDLALVSTEGDSALATALGAVRAALNDWRPADESWRCVTFAPVFSDLLRASGRLQRAILRVRAVVEAAG